MRYLNSRILILNSPHTLHTMKFIF